MDFKAAISQLVSVDGALSAAVVDYDSGMLLAGEGTQTLDLELASAGNTEVMRAKMKTMEMLKLDDRIEDILITLGRQYHLIRPLQKHNGLFLYFVLEKSKSNLALARRALVEAENSLN